MTDPVLKVQQNLSEILLLTQALEEQAVHKANDPLMPGGLAMVALANVANLESWEHRYEAAERFGMPTGHIADEDDTWEPPLQTLCFWSEQWRAQNDAEHDKRPTIASEASFIRWMLNWAWDNEPHWDDFARDIGSTKARLENLLYAGVRAERGVPCMYDECRGVRLVRFIDDDGNRSNWKCRNCEREWDEDAYWRHVGAANEQAQREHIDGEWWSTVDYAARDVKRSRKTIQSWVNQGRVATGCIIRGRRVRFVNLNQVRELDAEATRRNRKQSA